MKIGIIGIGLAGSKIAEALVTYSERTDSDFVSGAIAVNTATSDLNALSTIPVENRILIGEARLKGNGAGSDRGKGAEVAAEDSGEVLAAVGEFPVEKTDAFLVVAGLGGGTGSGGAPVVAAGIQRLYDEPVYGLGVLPSRDEGGIYQLNAAQSFQAFLPEVSNLLVLDNNAWWPPGEESLRDVHDYVNEEIARRIGVLMTASEAPEGVSAQMIVDASEIINTLSGGGISTIGYATTTIYPERSLVDRVLGRNREQFTGDAVNLIAASVRRAVLGRLTLPCKVDGAKRALLVVAGPPEAISRKGIERGIDWIEEQTGSLEVRGGDFPLPNERKVATLVLLSGVKAVPRLAEVQERAIEAQRNIESLREEYPEAFSGVAIPDEEDLHLPYSPDE